MAVALLGYESQAEILAVLVVFGLPVHLFLSQLVFPCVVDGYWQRVLRLW